MDLLTRSPDKRSTHVLPLVRDVPRKTAKRSYAKITFNVILRIPSGTVMWPTGPGPKSVGPDGTILAPPPSLLADCPRAVPGVPSWRRHP